MCTWFKEKMRYMQRVSTPRWQHIRMALCCLLAGVSAQMTLTLDRRERLLSQALDGFPHELKDMAVGDALCRYEDGTEWIAERKTVHDLGQSIRTGRATHSIIVVS